MKVFARGLRYNFAKRVHAEIIEEFNKLPTIDKFSDFFQGIEELEYINLSRGTNSLICKFDAIKDGKEIEFTIMAYILPDSFLYKEVGKDTITGDIVPITELNAIRYCIENGVIEE